jgi:hypothetical protein
VGHLTTAQSKSTTDEQNESRLDVVLFLHLLGTFEQQLKLTLIQCIFFCMAYLFEFLRNLESRVTSRGDDLVECHTKVECGGSNKCCGVDRRVNWRKRSIYLVVERTKVLL